MKMAVKIADEGLQELIEKFSDASPIDNDVEFSIYLALKELEQFRNTRTEPEPRALTVEWADIKDELPKFGTDVLVYSDSCQKIFKAYFHKAWWCFSYDNSPIRENVTHWMPLPQPPKE